MFAIEQNSLAPIRVGDRYGAWTVTEVRSHVSPWSGEMCHEVNLRCACGQTERTSESWPASRHCNRCRTGMQYLSCLQCRHPFYTYDPLFTLCAGCQRRNNTVYCVNCNNEICGAVQYDEICDRCADGDHRYTCPLCRVHWVESSNRMGSVHDDHLCRFCENKLISAILEFLVDIATRLNLALAA
jgi:hypothetical protein